MESQIERGGVRGERGKERGRGKGMGIQAGGVGVGRKYR